MSLDDTRSQLAARQAELMQALARPGTPLPGFDSERLAATGRSLLLKRARTVARAWPALAESLGERYEPLFLEYAGGHPLPRHGGPLADGRSFVRFLAGRGELPEEGRLETLAVDLGHATTAHGLKPRRWPTVKLAYLPRQRRLVLAARLPRLGARWLSLALGARRGKSDTATV